MILELSIQALPPPAVVTSLTPSYDCLTRLTPAEQLSIAADVYVRSLSDDCGGVLMSPIDRREDVNPEEGERKYGDVEFADSVNKKYPIDTEEHVRAAWSYIHQEDNAAKYDADDLKTIKERIRRAARKFNIEISAE